MSNVLIGGVGNDWIAGGGGADGLVGGRGQDTLYGDSGADSFFASGFGALDADHIADFSRATGDKIVLLRAAFTKIGAKLNASEFHVGRNAADFSDRIVYNPNNGKLFFDKDGYGGHAKSLFAIVDGHPVVTSHDFLMLA